MKNRARILLSSRERKALFRTMQIFDEEYTSFRKRDDADDLLDELDDGGIWNPCMLEVPPIEDEQKFLFYAACFGKRRYPEYAHTLEMFKDRLKYIADRRDGKKKHSRWPFLTSGGYYGSDWDQVRADAIRRDRFKCQDCGLTQNAHYSMFDEDLHVHHIVPKSECDTLIEANKLGNLVSLCRRCHIQRDTQLFDR